MSLKKAKKIVVKQDKKTQLLLEKRRKSQASKDIIQKLSHQHAILDSSLYDNLHSIKDINKKNKQMVSKPKNQNFVQEIQSKNSEKKNHIIQSEIQQSNIFKQNFDSNKNQNIYDGLELKIGQKCAEQMNLECNDYENIEINAKRVVPDLNFDEFDIKEEQKMQRRMEQKEIIDRQNKSAKDVLQKRKQLSLNIEKQLNDYSDSYLSLFAQNEANANKINYTELNAINRQKMPIFAKHNEIIDQILSSIVTIVSGETGCGKSTQVPQYLYLKGFGNLQHGPYKGQIGITQPRRMAAETLFRRVAFEMDEPTKVGFQVRHKANVTDDCSIKFMTDGILLKEMQSDFLLKKYSVIVVDEAHERKINTDLLLGLLSRVVTIRLKMAREQIGNVIQLQQNQSNMQSQCNKSESELTPPLRLVIMSATLRVEEFTDNQKLFPFYIQIMTVEARQYEVKTYFSKKTEEDYAKVALKHAIKVHMKLPPGDCLIFMTGQKEIREFVRDLKTALQAKVSKYSRNDNDYEINHKNDDLNAQQFQSQNSQNQRQNLSDSDEELSGFEDFEAEEQQEQQKQEVKPIEQLDKYKINENNDAKNEEGKCNIQIQDKEDEAQQFLQGKNTDKQSKREKIQMDITKYEILPLYTKLSSEEQQKIFNVDLSHNNYIRRFIVSTNVAETSVTIPRIKYIIDTGREKQKIVQKGNNSLHLSRYQVSWISKASADQRTGRVGRTEPGFCYRLYSSAVYGNIFKSFSDPEIITQPLDMIVLQLKQIGFQNLANFPFPTPPSDDEMFSTIQHLLRLQALQISEQLLHNNSNSHQASIEQQDWLRYEFIKCRKDHTTISELGRVLSVIPLAPRFSKFILQCRMLSSKNDNKNFQSSSNKKVSFTSCVGYSLLICCALAQEEIFNKQSFIINQSDLQQEVSNHIANNDSTFIEEDKDDEICQQRQQMKDMLSFYQEKEQLLKVIKEQRRKQVHDFKQSLVKFKQGDSDLFCLMNVLGEFIHHIQQQNQKNAQDNQNFDKLIHIYSQQNKLMPKALKEVYYDLNQLLVIFENLFTNNKEIQQLKNFFFDYKPPNALQEQTIIEAVVSSFIDQVARKVQLPVDQINQAQNFIQYAYESMYQCEEQFLHIHPQSFFAGQQPHFLIYSDIVISNKAYMKNITLIKDERLLFTYDMGDHISARKIDYLNDPAPFYLKTEDKVISYCNSSFGPKKWPIKKFKKEFDADSVEYFFVFLKLLLQGHIFGYFKALKNCYKIATNQVKISNLNPLITCIVNQLKLNDIKTAKQLQIIWSDSSRKNYLLDEISSLMQPQFIQTLRSKWPPTF